MRARTQRGMLRRVVAACPALVVALALSGAAEAAQQGAVSLSVAGGPAKDIEIRPGGEATTTFVVRNPARYSQRVEVEVSGLRIVDGSYSFEGAPSPGLTVTAEPARFTIAARSARDVLVVLRAGRSIPPGGAYAGVIFRGIPPLRPGESPVVGEIALPILGRVPGTVVDTGRIESFAPELPEVERGPVTFVVRFSNTGNVHYAPTGTVEVFAGARPLGAVEVEGKQVLPGTVRALKAVWAGQTPLGTLRARLHLNWGARGQYSEVRETTVRVVAPGASRPREEGGIGFAWLWWVLLLVAAYLVARRVQRRLQERRARRVAPVAATRPEEPGPWRDAVEGPAPVPTARSAARAAGRSGPPARSRSCGSPASTGRRSRTPSARSARGGTRTGAPRPTSGR